MTLLAITGLALAFWAVVASLAGWAWAAGIVLVVTGGLALIAGTDQIWEE